MKIAFTIARYFPMSRLTRLAWQRRLTERAYFEDIKNAQALGDESSIEIYKHDAYMEVSLIDDEAATIRSSALIAQARKLEVPLPAMRDEENKVSVDWEEGQHGFRWTLTDIGRAKVREAIRNESKARHEARIRWLAWITPVIGFAGIVATILTRK